MSSRATKACPENLITRTGDPDLESTQSSPVTHFLMGNLPAGKASRDIDSGLLPCGSCSHASPTAWASRAFPETPLIHTGFPEQGNSAKNGWHPLLEWSIQSCCHVLKVSHFCLVCPSLVRLCSDSASHAAVPWGVIMVFSNEPFLLPAAALGLRPQVTLRVPQPLPQHGFSQRPCSWWKFCLQAS